MEESLEEKIIRFVRENKYITRRLISKITGCGRGSIKKSLKYLEKRGLLKCLKYGDILKYKKDNSSEEIINKLRNEKLSINTYICFLTEDSREFNNLTEDYYIDMDISLEKANNKERVQEYIKKFGFTTYNMLSKDLGISRDVAKKYLRELIREGVLYVYNFTKAFKFLDGKLREELQKVLIEYGDYRKNIKIYILKDKVSNENKNNKQKRT